MKWRPDNWENPATGISEFSCFTHDAYEAGADAILKELAAHGNYCKYHRLPKLPNHKQPIRTKGWLVFIPDKE